MRDKLWSSDTFSPSSARFRFLLPLKMVRETDLKTKFQERPEVTSQTATGSATARSPPGRAAVLPTAALPGSHPRPAGSAAPALAHSPPAQPSAPAGRRRGRGQRGAQREPRPPRGCPTPAPPHTAPPAPAPAPPRPPLGAAAPRRAGGPAWRARRERDRAQPTSLPTREAGRCSRERPRSLLHRSRGTGAAPGHHGTVPRVGAVAPRKHPTTGSDGQTLKLCQSRLRPSMRRDFFTERMIR